MKTTVMIADEVDNNEVEQTSFEDGMSQHELALMREEEEALAAFTPFVELMSLASPNDHPREKDVKVWKEKYGKVYISTIIDDTDVYVWRTILRQEWKELQARGITDPYMHAEALLEKCLLFPRLQTVLYKKPAGVLPALETKIMFQSGFVSEQMLLNSIREIG